LLLHSPPLVVNLKQVVCPSHSKVSKVLMGMLDQLHSLFWCWHDFLGAVKP
jgi:hypothetical protein